MTGQDRDRQLMPERPGKEDASPGKAAAVGKEHRPPSPPRGTGGFLREPGSWVSSCSATDRDSFLVSVRAVGFLWELTRALISVISL